jgi:hypothetical protein
MDLMVETAPGSRLATWRLDKWPVSGEIPAQRIADHRNLYLDYDGPLVDNRGYVLQVESGECDLTIEKVKRPAKPKIWRLTLHNPTGLRQLTLVRARTRWTATTLDPPPTDDAEKSKKVPWNSRIPRHPGKEDRN